MAGTHSSWVAVAAEGLVGKHGTIGQLAHMESKTILFYNASHLTFV